MFRGFKVFGEVFEILDAPGEVRLGDLREVFAPVFTELCYPLFSEVLHGGLICGCVAPRQAQLYYIARFSLYSPTD